MNFFINKTRLLKTEVFNRSIIAIAVTTTSFFLFYIHKEMYIFFLCKPALAGDYKTYFITTNAQDLLFLYIDIANKSAKFIFIVSISTQCIIFVKPGLYASEQRIVASTYLGILLLWGTSTLLFFKQTGPMLWRFFCQQGFLNNSEALFNVYLEAKIENYMSFLLFFSCLQACAVFLALLVTFKLIKSKNVEFKVKRYRKFAYFIIMISTAVFIFQDSLTWFYGNAIVVTAVETLIIFAIALKKFN